MKRSPDAARPSTPTKRRRASPAEHEPEDSDTLNSEALFSNSSRECTIEDVLRDGIDPNSYISGSVAMRLLPQGGHTWFILKTSSGKNVKAEFRGKCSPHFELLKGNFKEEVKLGMRGATVIKPESGDTPTLLYEQGASLVFAKSRDSARIGKVIDTWSLERAAAQAEESGKTSTDYVDGNDWYGTPSRSRCQPPDTARSPSSPDAAASAGGKGGSHLAPQEAAPSRLAASTSGFSPSVQLAATRRSTSIAPPAVVASNVDKPSRPQGATPDADKQQTASSHPLDIASEVMPTNPTSDAQTPETPASNSIDRPASHVPQPQSNKPRSGATTERRFSGTTPTGESPHDCDSSVPLSKKGLKKRARKEKQRLALRDSDPPVRESRTSLPGEGTHSAAAETSAAPSESSGAQAQAPRDNPEDQPTRDAEVRPSTAASHPSRVSPSPKPVEQASPGNQAHPTQPPCPPLVPTTSQPERKPEEKKLSPSVASTRLTPKTEAADARRPLLAGFRSESAFYSPLARVERKDQVYNVIAVVTSAGFISQTSTGEFKTALSLTDPSVHEQNDFSVNMFAKRSVHLPEPVRGDIIMIRGVLGDYYKQRCGTAPSYKSWTWTIVDPRTREPIRKKGDICFQPTPSELQHCASLGEWWSSVAPAQELGVVHQIRPVRTGRIHRLLSEASPECEPGGYFDCTVEVLYGHENTNGIYSLYVTDYTHNTDMVPVERDWCPPLLTDKVLKLELFGEAAPKGPELKAGEYYFIGNCRMKRSTGGYLEATFSQVNKMRKLDEDALEDEPRLAELLQRKAEWHAKVEANGGTNEFPHRLFGEAEENKHFRCTAEVLLISPKDKTTYLYVTDYTRREDLVPVAFTVPRALQLQDCIVKIALHDEQADTAKQLETGDFVAIRNLRLRPSGSEQKFMGRLGGNQRLLSKLQASSPNNHELQALLMRKEEFESKKNASNATKGGPGLNKHKKKADRSREPSAPQEDAAASTSLPLTTPNSAPTAEIEGAEYSSITQVKASTVCPGKFLVRARIVDFYPPRISTFRVRRCMQCKATISDRQRICNSCDNPMDPDNKTSVGAYWNFALEVEDGDKASLQIFSCDDQCPILNGLDPEDLADNDDTTKELSERLRKVCGGLVELHGNEARRRMQETRSPEETPWLSLVLGSYSPEVEKDPSGRQYILLDCKPAA